jgi:hypothetical protein
MFVASLPHSGSAGHAPAGADAGADAALEPAAGADAAALPAAEVSVEVVLELHAASTGAVTRAKAATAVTARRTPRCEDADLPRGGEPLELADIAFTFLIL